MHRTWFHALLLIAWLFAGCGDDGGGDTASLIDRQIELDREQGMIECACDPGGCGTSTPSPVLLACFKSFAAKYEAQIAPELSCEIRRTEAQNDCFRDLDCADTAAWDACYDAGGDCDDSFTESHEEEVQACEEAGGPGTGGSTGTEPGSGGSSGTEPGSGGMGSAGAECASDADCGVCTSSAELGCCQCPFVSARTTCEEVGSEQCAGVSCAPRECPDAGMPACEAGRCVAQRPDDTPQTPPGSCQTNADCVVCDTAVVNGLVQCCMPCGMVTSADQCESNRALAGSCAAVSCPAVECTARPIATCVSGVCTASRGV